MMRLLCIALAALLLSPCVSFAARGFGPTHGTGVSDNIATGYTTLNTNTSWQIWAYRNGSGGGGFGRMFDKDGTSTGRRLFFFNNGTSTYNFAVAWSGGVGEWTIAAPSSGAWHHLVITYNGSSAANNPLIYVDGSSVTVTSITAPVGTIQTNTGVYHIGNRADGIRNWDGDEAEFSVWENTLLTAGNVTSLYNSGSGARADTIGTPTNYWKLCGTASPEPNEMGGGSTGTVTGALLQSHPFSNCSSSKKSGMLR